jgi:error-prone DNA polymerase
MEDEHGLINIIVYPDLYQENRHVVRGDPFLVVEGILHHRANTTNLLAERIWPLSEARSQFTIPENLGEGAAQPITILTHQREDIDTEFGEVRQISPASHNYR